MSEREMTAFHEAGHVAAAWLLLDDAGIWGETSIEPLAQTEGHAEVGPAMTEAELVEAQRLTLLGEIVGMELRDRIETAVLVNLSGTVAELMERERRALSSTPPRKGSRAAKRIEQRKAEAAAAVEAGEPEVFGDHANELRHLEALTTSPAELHAYRIVLLERAHRLARNGLYGRIVAAVAEALLERHTLSRVEAIQVVRASIGIPLTKETTVEPGERERVIAQANDDIEEATRRAKAEGWTFELREQYLTASYRITRARDTWTADGPAAEATH